MADAIQLKNGDGNPMVVSGGLNDGKVMLNCCCFVIEPSMRRVNEGRALAQFAGATTWPNKLFNADGSLIPAGGTAPATQAANLYFVGAAGTLSMPVDGFYANDLLFNDAHFGNPVGTYAAGLVNLVIAQLRVAVYIQAYCDPDSFVGNSSFSTWTVATIGSPAAGSATTVNYSTKLGDCKTVLGKLSRLTRQASAVAGGKALQVESRDGATPGAMWTCLQAHLPGTYGFQKTYQQPAACALTGSVVLAGGAVTKVWTEIVEAAPNIWVGSAYKYNSKWTADFSPFLNGGSGLVYFKPTGSGLFTFGNTATLPFAGASDGKYGLWSEETPAGGAVWLSGFLSSVDNNNPNDFPVVNSYVGWYIDVMYVAFAPTFLNAI